MKKFLMVAAVATVSMTSVALAASTDSSRSDSVFIPSYDRTNPEPKAEHLGSHKDYVKKLKPTSASGTRDSSRSDSVFVSNTTVQATGPHHRGNSATERDSSRSDSVGWH